MAAAHKLSEADKAFIVKRASEGSTTRRIAQELKTQRGVSVSHVAVGYVVRQARSESAEVAKTVVREILTSGLREDVETLEVERARLARIARTLGEAVEKKPAPMKLASYTKILASLTKVTEVKLHF